MKLAFDCIESHILQEEKRLLNKLQEGDHIAFADIYNQYVDILFRYGSRLGFEKELLEDAIQDVFYYLYTHRSSLKHVNNLTFYLLRSLKNRLLLINASKWKTVDVDIHTIPSIVEINILDHLIEEEDKVEIKKNIEKYLSELTIRQKEAIFLRYLKELSYEEIAEILDMSVPSVRNLVLRGMNKIRIKYPNSFFFLFFI